MTFGEKIHLLRIQHKMTLDDLAKELGLDKTSIIKYEKGNVVNVKIATLVALCKIFDVTPSYLIYDNYEPGPANAEKQEIINAFREADDRARKDALKILLGHKREKSEQNKE